ncbi:hypothetical protein [Croceiramulus getboli]|nr:hypothetical protein P8624_06590 [Flavobacteriaceae bacterium YJPT1-3]
MDKREFTKHLKEYWGLDEFKIVGKGAGAVSFENGEKEILLSYSKFPGKFILSPGLLGFVSFPEVEEILEKYYTRHSVGYNLKTIYTTSRRVEDFELQTIATLEDIEKATPNYREMLELDIFPFFDTYTSLEKIASKIDSLSLNKLSDFIFSPLHLRIMTIKRLVRDKDWESYANETMRIYKEQATGKYKASFEPFYRFLPDLFEELKNMEV